MYVSYYKVEEGLCWYRWVCAYIHVVMFSFVIMIIIDVKGV